MAGREIIAAAYCVSSDMYAAVHSMARHANKAENSIGMQIVLEKLGII